MQKEINQKDNLLNDDGTLKHTGYSKQMLLKYNKEVIKNKKRVKEWDYYYIADYNFALGLTIVDFGYASAVFASVVDFKNQLHYNNASFTKQTANLPQTSFDGISSLKTKNAEFSFEVKKGIKTLKGKFKNFYKKLPNPDLEFEIKIYNNIKEHIVKASAFKNKNHFYYSHRTNCLFADGYFVFDGKKYSFDADTTLAAMDWSRGVLPHSSVRYWANMQVKQNGKLLGFSIGKYGNQDDAEGNAIFVDGVAHPVGNIKFYIRNNGIKFDYLSPWTIYSDDGKLELLFEPFMDRKSPINYLIWAHNPHQVFGHFSGKLVLDNGKKIEIENLLGFIERQQNLW